MNTGFTTNAITDIVLPFTAATSGGINPGVSATLVGVVWNTTGNPYIPHDNYVTESYTGGTAFTCTLTGLSGNILYYVSAYRNNPIPNYAGEVTFVNALSPAVTTLPISAVTDTTAIGNGKVTDDGGGIDSVGIVLNTTGTPTTGDTVFVGAYSEIDEPFSVTLTDLNQNTHYYVRAYAVNKAGISYGSDVEFDTLISPTIKLTTLPASGITNTTATAYGVVDGITGETISQVGFYFDPLTGITYESHYVATGATFSYSFTGLTSNTPYEVVAYAIATGDTRYNDFGQEIYTAPNPPEIGSIKQPTSPSEKGSVTFINIFDGQDTIIWSGTTTGTTITSGGTSFTVTGLTVGTYFFSIKTDVGKYYSPITTVVIEVPSTRVLSEANYRLYERTGIGDGAAYEAELAAIEALDEYETFEDDY